MKNLMQNWKNCGICKGDTVLLHSKTVRILMKNIHLDIPTLLQSFLELLSDKGTLLLPLFNFEFTKGVGFDIRTTPSQMGVLTEYARKAPNFIRTKHPVYSFAVCGKYALEFEKLENKSAYAQNSPFGLLKEMDGKIAVLDLPDQHSMTFYHHIEECLNVPYRFHKEFTANYTDKEGKTELRTYEIFVRNLEQKIETFCDPMGELLWKAKIYQGERANTNCGLRVAKAREVFKFVAKIIQDGKALGTLYKHGGGGIRIFPPKAFEKLFELLQLLFKKA